MGGGLIKSDGSDIRCTWHRLCFKWVSPGAVFRVLNEAIWFAKLGGLVGLPNRVISQVKVK